jgi:hypothetical protein
MEGLSVALSVMAFLGFVGFGQWLRHQRRMMVHRERLAAVEKGVELPPLELESNRREWNVQRILLLGGLIWVSVGLAAFLALNTIVHHPSAASQDVPFGIQWIGVGPIGIGLAHLITYLVGRNKA